MTLPEFKQIVDAAKREIKEIDVDKLKEMQKSGADFTLIDVRDPDEWAAGTIPGAVTISRGKLEVNVDQATTDKDRTIVLYCGGGSRSALAAKSLKEMGFKHPISLIGGYRAWKESK